MIIKSLENRDDQIMIINFSNESNNLNNNGRNDHIRKRKLQL